MTRRSTRRIEISATARADLEAIAEAALPDETGGILLGWRSQDGVHVARPIEVPDPHATSHGYQRNFALAQAALWATLANQPSDTPLGYIGEWHSHPAPVAASGIDLRAIRHLARDVGAPIVLVVASLTANTWRLSAHLASRFRIQPATIKDRA